MNNNEHDNKLEQRIRFVAKRYREGSLDPDKAWQKFASEHAISRKVSFRRYWIGAAAVVLVLVGLGTWFTVERNAPDWVAITTATGQMKDVYLNCHLDKTHPLAWGLDQDEIAVIKTNDIIFQKDRDPYVSPLYYTKKPLLSGFLSADNANLLREEPAIMVKPYRSGKVIVFADDMNFRSYFFGTSKLFMNALFYNKCM